MKKLFQTRAASNEGVRVPLEAPDGSETPYWLQIIGCDSDIFRKKRTEVNRAILLKKALKGAKSAEDALELGDAFHAEQKLKLIASLVIDWNLTDDEEKPLPCTAANVEDFLTEAPQIADLLDRLGTDRAFFLEEASKRSKNGQPESLTSQSAQTAEPAPELPSSTSSEKPESGPPP